ncbi:hypothetical protein ACIRRA_01840 [Nocardia sp. NPDC101769]|uniref:hypothetical protein n=1 Tax=Nocardia sp. NPDC101769 TaxID=3364333 RepID=UPI0037FABE22
MLATVDIASLALGITDIAERAAVIAAATKAAATKAASGANRDEVLAAAKRDIEERRGVVGEAYSMRLMRLVTARVTTDMTEAGYRAVPPLDDSAAEAFVDGKLKLRTLWFTVDDSLIPGMTTAITAELSRGRGLLGLAGNVWTGATALDELVQETPQRATDPSWYYTNGALIESVPFSFFTTPNDLSRDIDIRAEASIGDAMNEFLACLRGPAAWWLTDRDSLDKLFDIARTGNPRHILDTVNPDPRRLRGIAVLGVLNDRSAAVAELLAWYRERTEFYDTDSLDEITRFETALAQRYPSYARARIGG